MSEFCACSDARVQLRNFAHLVLQALRLAEIALQAAKPANLASEAPAAGGFEGTSKAIHYLRLVVPRIAPQRSTRFLAVLTPIVA